MIAAPLPQPITSTGCSAYSLVPCTFGAPLLVCLGRYLLHHTCECSESFPSHTQDADLISFQVDEIH
jgi:hypothetical protein